jgi:morphogenetic protein associated with SpoVID
LGMMPQNGGAPQIGQMGMMPGMPQIGQMGVMPQGQDMYNMLNPYSQAQSRNSEQDHAEEPEENE